MASASRLAPLIGRPRRSGLLEVVEEPVDDTALPGGVLQGLADDAAGQVGRDAPDLLAQRDRHLTAVRLDLRVTGGDDGLALALALLAHLGDDRRALLTGLLGDPGRLVAGLGELGLVLLERLLGLGLSLGRSLQATLDRVPPLFQGLLDVRKELLSEEAEDDEEAEETDDQFDRVGDERVLARLLRQEGHHV